MKKIKLLIIFILVICLITGCKKNNNSIMDDKQNDIFIKQMETEEIERLLKKVPYISSEIGKITDAYLGQNVKVNDLTPMIYYLASINRYNDSYSMKKGNDKKIQELLKKNNIDRAVVYYISDINQFLEENYNMKLNVSADNGNVIVLNDEFVTFVFNNDKLQESGSVTLKLGARKEDNSIVIYEKKAFLVKDDKNYKIYSNTNINGQTPINIIDVSEFDKVRNMLKEEDFLTFKHTFKENISGYYWYSTEVVD